MVNKYTTISVRESTKDMLQLIKKEYLKHHPDHKDFILGENFLTKKAFDHYLR